jgi:3D-(3,5/4)-trihydroxycyclohexane-1,2-dione acylhydrolase (decyclizing)
MGARVVRATTVADLRDALRTVLAERDRDRPVVIHIETDPFVPAPSGGGWWDVPIAEVATAATVDAPRDAYRENKARQRPLI